jgi:hypothetical protein
MSAPGAGGGFLATDAVAVSPPPRRENAQAEDWRKRPAEVDAGVRSGESSRGDRDRAAVRGKLHPALLSVFDRQQQGNLQLTPQEGRYIRNGKVAVEIWLTDATPEVLSQLKRIGFELAEQPKVAKILTGRIDIAKLMDLAKLSGVRHVNPLTR